MDYDSVNNVTSERKEVVEWFENEAWGFDFNKYRLFLLLDFRTIMLRLYLYPQPPLAVLFAGQAGNQRIVH